MPRMTARGELPLAGKLTVRAGSRKLVLAKRAWESERHVLLKALVFGLYVGRYPDLAVERRIGHRYTPDLIALGPDDGPVFWGECGETGREKLAHLVRAFPATHLVLAKQVASLVPYEAMVRASLVRARRRAPVELLNLPANATRFIGDDGEITIGVGDVALVRF
ncbi:MAG: hypothetical protein AVDCRST_MAG19-4771 [uncultured Thermomicrobiales bacterium]|uniref:Uncharacterized protein n=1 Tax=uncultured Thermomicrobiales bacterium TaxID=1645740 RepID=A0A6J4VPB4_9BACT|nr:MAG: hypothetical protein AVDCRST_MAG19-4771 [uncultured Thermomicrobiales bacterium]